MVKTQTTRSKHADSTPTPSQSPLEGIGEVFQILPGETCIELTRRLLSTDSSFPTGETRPTAVIETIILFIG